MSALLTGASPAVESATRAARAVVAELELSSLQVELRARSFMGIWTRFRRRFGAAHSLPRPPLEAIADGVVRFELRAALDSHHVRLALPLEPGEHVVGFGERFNAVDQRGWALESYCEEGAVGLGERASRLLTALRVRWNPWPKGPTTAYKPLPWWFSSRGYGLLLESYAPAFFDVGKSDPGRLVADVAASTVTVVVFTGATPRRILERMTDYTGRPPRLPDWTLGPWLDALGGQRRVREVARLTREHQIPCSAIWAEDWHGYGPRPFGDVRWSYDSIEPVLRDPCDTHYPDFSELVDELHDGGFKFLGYYFPYVHTVDPAYAEAERRGYFLRDRHGETVVFKMLFEKVSQVDLDNPEARDWYASELRRGIAMGFDGWMADFGEYTPLEAVTHTGEAGIDHHNRYPLLWAQLNRDAIAAEGRSDDMVFFSRSAALGQQAVSPLMWTGDSNTDFERWDGLPSNLRGLLSAGLSGLSLYTVDVGGYMSVVSRGRDREVLARWAELGALLVVMRTHHGTHPRRSVQFDHDSGTLGHFARCARLHAALYPLRRALADEASRVGVPVARPLLLEFPDDSRAWSVEDQFMLGPDLLVAPVVERGARERFVYLPEATDWIDLWSGRRYRGGGKVELPAPLGQIPLLLRAGGLLPTFDRRIDTFVRRIDTADPTVRTLDDAEQSLSLLLGPDCAGEQTLHDGTRITIGRAAPAGPTLPVAATVSHALLPADMMSSWRRVATVAGGAGRVDLGDRGWLQIEADRDRVLSIYVPRES